MRGKDAAQLLEDPVLKEAFEEIEKFYVQQWRTSLSNDDGWAARDDAYNTLRAMDVFRNQLVSFVTTGKLAETKSNRRED